MLRFTRFRNPRPRPTRLRRQMAPITITTDHLHLHNFRRVSRPSFQETDERIVLADLLIGNSLLITDFAFTLDPKSTLGLTQNWDRARPKVDQSLILRHQFPEMTPPLGEFLAQAIFDWVFVDHRKQIMAFLDGQSEILEMPIFRPKSWRGKSLKISIAAFRAFSFEYHTPDVESDNTQNRLGEVRCQLSIDRHLTFWNVPIYSQQKGWFYQEPRIQVPCVNQAIMDLLKNEGLRRHARNTFKQGLAIDFSGRVFLYCTADYHPDGSPSPITLV